jgi:methionyl-tRNA synthetase
MPESDKPTITYDDFAKLDLRIATVIAAEPHPNADRLVKLQVALGDHTRQVCAGIRQYYDPEKLVGRQVVVVANLAPRTIRGEESNGMLLAASDMTGSDDPRSPAEIILLMPDKETPPGSRVS